jgi:microcystin degradation protein MlrC
MRVGILGLLHESNTFISEMTEIYHFEDDVLAVGDSVRRAFPHDCHEIAGFFAGLSETEVDAVPIFAARAMPYGVISASAWSQLMTSLRKSLATVGPLDGLLVAAHGATVSEEEPDADGFWLGEVRRCVGETIPIIGTLDPHANLSQRMVDVTDALIAYRTNPHVDQFDAGLRAASLMRETLRGNIRPTQAACFPPLAINIERQETEAFPCRDILNYADSQLEQGEALSNSFLMGFSYADVAEMGSATLAITDGDSALASRLASELADHVWKYQHHFTSVGMGTDDAVKCAIRLQGPVCLLDTGDNIGGGSAGDGTWIAQALQKGGVKRAIVCLVDPLAVTACEGKRNERISLRVGGRTAAWQGPPLVDVFKVVDVRDGRFKEDKVRHGGFSVFDQGRVAILQTDADLTLIVTSKRVAPFSLAQISSCDLDPRQFHILVAKGVTAPIAAYREVCTEFIRVTTPGSTTTDIMSLPYKRRRRPMFPFEPVAHRSACSSDGSK